MMLYDSALLHAADGYAHADMSAAGATTGAARWRVAGQTCTTAVEGLWEAATTTLHARWGEADRVSGRECRLYGADAGTGYSETVYYTHTLEAATTATGAGERWAVAFRGVASALAGLWHPAGGGRRPPEDRLREIIRQRVAPAVGRPRQAVEDSDDFRELRARETLEKVIGADRFRRYVRDGFVSVRGKSGMTYQIHPGHALTRVYRDGVPQPSLCVVLDGDFPPSDSVIVRFLMVLNDEAGFRARAIPHSPPAGRRDARGGPGVGGVAAGPRRPLAEVYREFRGQPPTPRPAAAAG